MQDTPHIMTKLMSRINTHIFQLGETTFSLAPLWDIFQNPRHAVEFEARTKLRRSDLSADKMNFHAAQRLFSLNVITALRQTQPPSRQLDALLAYLLIGNYIMRSYLDPELHPCARIRFIFCARFFLEAWLADLHKRKDFLKPSAMFITTATYDCVMLNSDSLLLLTHWLCEYPELRSTVPYAPWVFTSLACEWQFRAARADRHGNENFSVIEFFRHVHRSDALNILAAAHPEFKLSGANRKHWQLDERCRTAQLLPADVNVNTLVESVRQALSDAKELLQPFGIPLEAPEPGAPDELADVMLDGIVCDSPCSSIGSDVEDALLVRF